MMNMGHVILTLAAINAVMYEEGKERKLPLRVKMRLSRVKEILERDAKHYEAERVRLVTEFGDEIGEGEEKHLEVKDPVKLDKFYAGLEEILKTEIDPDYIKLSKEDLTLIEELDIDITEAQVRAFFEYAVEA